MAKTTGLIAWLRRLLVGGGAIVPVVRLHGVIAAENRAGRLNIETVAPLLQRAFEMKGGVVALVVNSPGGSAVQSRLIAKRIRDLAAEHRQACAGVRRGCGGFGRLFHRHGWRRDHRRPFFDRRLDRRHLRRLRFSRGAGQARRRTTRPYRRRNKSTLDPFLPERSEDVERIKQFELDVHEVFIDWVKKRRGDRLSAPDEQLFTGEFWSGVRGLDLGLVDQLGDMHEMLRTRFGEDVRMRLIRSRARAVPVAPARPRRRRCRGGRGPDPVGEDRTMTGVLLRIIIIAIIGAFIYFGIRKIWRDWTRQFKVEDKAVHERDLREREKPGVITLERGADGTFRPPDRDGRR